MFKKRPWFLVGALIFIEIVSQITTHVHVDVGELHRAGMSWIYTMPIGFLQVVWDVGTAMFIGMGSTAFWIKAHDSLESVSIRDFWHPKMFWEFFGATLLSFIIILLGLVLLIVPGIIFSLKYFFVPYLVIDRKLSARAALKESARITEGHKWNLFLFSLVLIGVNALGLLCFVFGLLISIPVSMLAMVHVYRMLEHKANEVVASAA